MSKVVLSTIISRCSPWSEAVEALRLVPGLIVLLCQITP